MTKHSEEGNIEGLGWVDADTVRFDVSKISGFKVPHMGWSEISIVGQNPLWVNLPDEPRFYFVHAYHFLFSEKTEISAICSYSYDFACAFKKDNIYGTQFHPEKSHKFGMKILENFNKL
jgi:glutamine amidotransferase